MHQIDHTLHIYKIQTKANFYSLTNNYSYFKQIKDSLQSLAQESQAPAIPNQQTGSPEVCAASPVKKMKTGPFDWFKTTPSEADG